MNNRANTDDGMMALPMALGVLVGFILLAAMVQQSIYWSAQWFPAPAGKAVSALEGSI